MNLTVQIWTSLFGKVFSLLDLDYRIRQPLIDEETSQKLDYMEGSLHMPLSFRIVATMNTYDRSLLFSLGYAFLRRFAIVDKPSLIPTVPNEKPEIKGDNYDEKPIISSIDWIKGNDGQALKDDILKVVYAHFGNEATYDKASVLSSANSQEATKAVEELKRAGSEILGRA